MSIDNNKRIFWHASINGFMFLPAICLLLSFFNIGLSVYTLLYTAWLGGFVFFMMALFAGMIQLSLLDTFISRMLIYVLTVPVGLLFIFVFLTVIPQAVACSFPPYHWFLQYITWLYIPCGITGCTPAIIFGIIHLIRGSSNPIIIYLTSRGSPEKIMPFQSKPSVLFKQEQCHFIMKRMVILTRKERWFLFTFMCAIGIIGLAIGMQGDANTGILGFITLLVAPHAHWLSLTRRSAIFLVVFMFILSIFLTFLVIVLLIAQAIRDVIIGWSVAIIGLMVAYPVIIIRILRLGLPDS
ncbi:MAG: hypothetical protein Q6373_023130 [Candidatus Sigynarchaeota archaeon]